MGWQSCYFVFLHITALQHFLEGFSPVSLNIYSLLYSQFCPFPLAAQLPLFFFVTHKVLHNTLFASSFFLFFYPNLSSSLMLFWYAVTTDEVCLGEIKRWKTKNSKIINCGRSQRATLYNMSCHSCSTTYCLLCNICEDFWMIF